MMRSPWWLVVLCVGTLSACIGLPRGVVGQEIRLEGPELAFPDAFGMVQSIRELADGRVIVADPLGQELVVLDLEAGSRRALGRLGRGPGEFLQPDAVWALPGDSTLLVDLGNGRLTVLGPDLRYASSSPLVLGNPASHTYVIGLPAGMDGEGHIYVKENAFLRPSSMPDSAGVLRIARSPVAIDTVARVGLPQTEETQGGRSGGRTRSIRQMPLGGEDAWGVAPDGRIAAVRSADYHLEWIHPGGRVVAGPAVEHRRVPIRDGEKEEWALELARAGGGLNYNSNTSNGVTEVSLTRAAAFGGTLDVSRITFPSHKPPFYSDRIGVDPLGRAWVRRHVAAGERPTYDLFDRTAERVQVVLLPPDRRLVGFGRNALYAVRFDEFDLAYVERYALPAGRSPG